MSGIQMFILLFFRISNLGLLNKVLIDLELWKIEFGGVQKIWHAYEDHAYLFSTFEIWIQ